MIDGQGQLWFGAGEWALCVREQVTSLLRHRRISTVEVKAWGLPLQKAFIAVTKCSTNHCSEYGGILQETRGLRLVAHGLKLGNRWSFCFCFP